MLARQSNEPAVTSSTSKAAQRNAAVITAPMQPLLEKTEAMIRPLAFYDPPTEANCTDEHMRLSRNLHLIVTCDGMGAAVILQAVYRAIFAAYSIQAFPTKQVRHFKASQ